MAQLSSVIGSILRDIISAQHEANLYSLALSENYGKDGKVKDFQLPGVLISDMELELKYGVISSEENQEQFNIKYNKFRQFAKSLCDEAAETAVTCAVATVTEDADAGEGSFFTRLGKEEELNRNFRKFLSRNMRSALGANLYEAIDRQTGAVAVDVVVRKLADVAYRKFIDDPDLDNLFSGDEGKALKAAADGNIREALTNLVEKLSEGMNFKRMKVFPKLNVAVTADELAKMPEDAIHVFKLKFAPTTCTVAEMDDDDETDDFEMR